MFQPSPRGLTRTSRALQTPAEPGESLITSTTWTRRPCSEMKEIPFPAVTSPTHAS